MSTPESKPTGTSEQELTPEEQAFLEWFSGRRLTPQQINLILNQARPLGEAPQHPVRDTLETQAEARARLLKLAPKREDFPDEESYLEAKAGFQHQVGPLLRQYGGSSTVAKSSPKAKP